MDQQQRTKRFGIYVILCACVLRFTVAGGFGTAAHWLAARYPFPFLTYAETGQDVRFSSSSGDFLEFVRESPGPWLPEPERPRFAAEDAVRVEMDYDCSRRPDLAALMEQPLSWDLASGEPSVLILHTHTTESYTKAGEVYRETARYRTLEEGYNMLSIGEAVAEILEDAGIGVIHDRQIHDYPSYNGSYVHARSAIESILAEHPSVQLVLDLHRDASDGLYGQMRTEALVAGEASAQLMFVVGTDVSRQSHGNWQQNLALALKLQVLLEEKSPGIMRPINLRSQRFNQDLSAGALLVEVGAAGNTRREALTAARELAEAIKKLAKGTEHVFGTGERGNGNVSK